MPENQIQLWECRDIQELVNKVVDFLLKPRFLSLSLLILDYFEVSGSLLTNLEEYLPLFGPCISIESADRFRTIWEPSSSYEVRFSGSTWLNKLYRKLPSYLISNMLRIVESPLDLAAVEE